MNIKRFFERAKERGIDQSQISVSKSSSTSVSLFHHEIDSFGVETSQSVLACGIYNGKMGACRTERFDKDTFDFLIDGIIDSASTTERPNEVSIFEGSKKYKRGSTWNKELSTIPLSKKIDDIRTIENRLFESKVGITEVESVYYSEVDFESEFYNSFGLKLKSKSNYYAISAGVVGQDEGKPRTAFSVAFGSDYSAFKMDEFIKDIEDKLIGKFGGTQIKSGKYKTVLKNSVFASLLNYFLSNLSSEEVQKHSSFLIGKLGQQVASKKVTIEERPLDKNIFFSYFDGEGVAKKNKLLIDKGVLKTYLYNRETAAKEGVETTGNARLAGNKMVVENDQVRVKASKKEFKDLIKGIKKGVFITDIQGLGTGMNAQSGDFSCQAQGFSIVDGKIDKPLTLITLSGNLLQMLGDVQGFDNQLELSLSGVACANVLIKKMSIGGE